MKSRKIIFAIFFVAIFFTGCKNSKKNFEPQIEEPQISQKKSPFQNFYFFNGGFLPVANAKDSPDSLFLPWTEKIRVSGAAQNQDFALLLVNKLGILKIDGTENFSLLQDSKIFSEASAENLFFWEDEPIFTLKKNSLFAKSVQNQTHDANQNQENFSLSVNSAQNRPYIVRAALNSNGFFPVVTYADLEIFDEEISGSFFDGESWVTSIKNEKSDFVSFRYIFWQGIVPILRMKPHFDAGKIKIQERTKEFYREKFMPKDFSRAPERLKSLLKKLPTDFSFEITLKTEENVSPQFFLCGEDAKIKASAILTPTVCLCIFEDGTVFFCGALFGKHSANGGKPYAFQLPPLPAGFSYTDFAFCKNILAIGWEENDFYKTAKSGFLIADLEEILYAEEF